MLYWHLSSLVVFNIKKLQIKNHKQILKNCFKTAKTLDYLLSRPKAANHPKRRSFKKSKKTLYLILSEKCCDNQAVHNKIMTIKHDLNKTNFYYFSYWNFVTMFYGRNPVLPSYGKEAYQRNGSKPSLGCKFEEPLTNCVGIDQRSEISKNSKLLKIKSRGTTTCISVRPNQSVTEIKNKKLEKINRRSNQTKIKFQMIFLIRPLLTVSRSETKILSNFWNLPVFPDRTNLQLKYRRNRIRYQLLPALKILFNPKIDRVLLEFSEITNKENFYFGFLAKKLIKKSRWSSI